jgi:hypothetical protein
VTTNRKIRFNAEALEALRKEFERDHPGEPFTASACAALIVEKMRLAEAKAAPKKKPKRK